MFSLMSVPQETCTLYYTFDNFLPDLYSLGIVYLLRFANKSMRPIKALQQNPIEIIQ